MGIIYKLTAPNGKGYIGQTSQTFEKRMTNHKSSAANLNKKDGCRLLNNAIRKHGWDNFTKEILLQCNDEDLDDYEIHFIEEHVTLVDDGFGYNLTAGGGANRIVSEATKQKMRESALEYRKNNPDAYANHETPRTDPRTEGWPKYLCIQQDWPRIAQHPNCAHKRFADKTKTFEENLADAKAFLELLNKGEVKVERADPDRPKGLQICKDKGFYVDIKNKQGHRCRQLFTDQKIPLEERRKQAIEFLNSIDK